MEFHIKSVLIFICVTIVGSHADVLGNDETTIDDVYVKKIHAIAHRKLLTDPTNWVEEFLKKHKGHTDIRVGHDRVEIKSGTKGKPIYVGVQPGINPFDYYYHGNKSKDGRSLFFLEKDMKPGHQLTMNFTQSTNEATFIPKEKARSLPFSTDKMLEILREFSMQPGSKEAQVIEETIKGCERKGIPGEQKYCATCLEDMIDYAKSTLGKNVKVIYTKAKDGYKKGLRYTIHHIMKASRDDDVMVCHKQNYAYAVYYCHKTRGTSHHIVYLISEKGTKVRVVVVCHKYTSAWNPKHIAFQALGVKPGSLPICHFLPEDHLVWVRS